MAQLGGQLPYSSSSRYDLRSPKCERTVFYLRNSAAGKGDRLSVPPIWANKLPPVVIELFMNR